MHTATQAERLATIYGQITGGEALPETMEAEALADETQPDRMQLPKLHLVVAGENRILADLVTSMTSAIVSDSTLYYFEITCTSDATAHAYMAALTEKSKDRTWEGRGQIFGPTWRNLDVPDSFQIRDSRLAIHGWHSGTIHHVAALATEARLLIADNENALWMKLRERVSCPTLPHWGPSLMPRIRRSGMLTAAQTFGIGKGIEAYLLAPNANDVFDNVVREYVLEHGLD